MVALKSDARTTPGVVPATAPSGSADAAIVVRDLRKSFRRRGGTAVPAVDDITLEVRRGEMLVLLGPSGCGKTTLLRCIAGLEEPEHGEITVDGRLHFSSERKLNRAPNKRNIAMMFQSYALWPHMTVGKNVAYSLHGSRLSRAEVTTRVDEILETVGLPGLAGQYPGQLSGGQQQRVALARSLVTNPSVILFDEPLSNVDAKVREELRVELMTKQKELGFTGVYVTHDQVEALQLADRLAVLESGRIAQIDTPEVIYSYPRSKAVARFVGTLNEVPGTLLGSDGDGFVTIQTEFGPLYGRDCSGTLGTAAPGSAVVAGIRAESLHTAGHGHAVTPTTNTVRLTLVTAGFAGAYSIQVLGFGDSTLSMHSAPGASAGLPVAEDGRVEVSFDRSDVMVFPA